MGIAGSESVAVAAVLAAMLLLPQAGRSQTAAGIGIVPNEIGGSARILSEDDWALQLVEGLGLEDALAEGAGTGEAFSLLCADAVEMDTDAQGRRVPARSAFWAASEVATSRNPAEPVRIVLDVPATALYQLAVEGEGLQRWAVDQRAIEHLDPTALGVALAPELLPLRQGTHELAGYMSRRSRVDRVELSAFRPLCVAPADGWHAGRSLTHGAAARTLVRSLGLERYLPEQEAAVEIEGERYTSASAWGGRTNEVGGAPVSGEAWARAGDSAAEFSYRIRLDEPGIFSVRARVYGDAVQIWSVDGRYRIAVRGGRRADRFAWAHVMTTPLVSGEHVIRALVPRNSGVDVIEVVRHRSAAADYVDVIEQMGFRSGASDTPVTRGLALANLLRPAFFELSTDFLTRMATSGPQAPLVAIEMRPKPLYSRPVAPVLPSEL
jgi:hypothetical protein